MKKWFVLLLVGLLALLLASTASATETVVCPEGDGWTKVEGLGDGVYSITINADSGYLIDDVCIKRGREPLAWFYDQMVDPFNSPTYDDPSISHYSYTQAWEPVQCGRCSTIADFTWVEWVDRYGACTGDYYNERVETYPSTECGAIFGCMDDAALNFVLDANFPDESCYYECDFTHEVEGLSSPGPWSDWEFGCMQFERCRDIFTAIQHRDDTTNKLCELESRESVVCEYHPDACTNIEGGQWDVPEGYIAVGPKGTRCVPKPFNLKEVAVSVGASCGRSVEGIVYQLQGGVEIVPEGGATLTLDSVEYTASSPWWGGFGTHSWSAVATEGYVIVGADSGSFEINNSDCNETPEDVPETGEVDAPLLIVGGMTVLGLAALSLGIYYNREERAKEG